MSDIKIGDTFRYQGASVAVVAVGGPDDAFPVRDGEVGIRAMSSADGLHLGWIPVTSGEYEAFRDLAEFLKVAEPTTAPQDHGPLAAPLSDRTLDKVLSRPTRVFGFNVVTISPQGIPGGPRLDGVVSRQRAQDELDELEPFMVDGWKTVMVELREVTS